MTRRGALALGGACAAGVVAGLLAWSGWDGDRVAGPVGGQLLVAADDGEPPFGAAVVLVIADHADGAFGVVTNRPVHPAAVRAMIERRLGTALPAGGVPRLLLGGPVASDQAFTLHSADRVLPRTRVNGAWAVTEGLALLHDHLAGRGPRRAVGLLGYAGWGPGQLAGERRRGGWLIAPASEELVFDADGAASWREAKRRAEP